MVEAHEERHRPFGEADHRRGLQRVALGLEHRVAVERHRRVAAAFHPQLVATRGGHAQLAGPAQADPPTDRQRAQVAADHVDGAGGRHSDRSRGALDRGREARRAAPRRGEPEGHDRDDEREGDAAPGAGAPVLSPSARRGWRSRGQGPPGRARARREATAPRSAPTATRRARGARSRRRSRAGRPARETHQAGILRPLTGLPHGSHNALTLESQEGASEMKTLCLVAALGLALSCAAARAAELKVETPRRSSPSPAPTARPTSCRTTRTSRPSCWPGSRRPSPEAERRSASRSVRAATRSGSSTSRTLPPAPTPRRRTRSSPSRSGPTTRCWPTPTSRRPSLTGC